MSRLLLVSYRPFLQSKLPLVPYSNKPTNFSEPRAKILKNTSRLPSDPFFYKVPDSDETVRFYGYGTSLPREDVIHAIVVASRRIKRHGSSNEPIPDKVLRYGSGDVYLVMHHTGRMTWRLWETALRGIMDFLERYEYVDMEFDVGQVGFERIFGTGALGSMKS